MIMTGFVGLHLHTVLFRHQYAAFHPAQRNYFKYLLRQNSIQEVSAGDLHLKQGIRGEKKHLITKRCRKYDLFSLKNKSKESLCVFPVEHVQMQACVGLGVCGPLSHCNRLMNERKIPLSIFNNSQIRAASGAACELKLNFVLSLLANKRADLMYFHI